MNIIIAAYPQLAMKQLLFRDMIKKKFDGTPQSIIGADVVEYSNTITANIDPKMYDGEYGIAIPISSQTDFIHKISIKFFTASNVEVDCTIDTFFYARQHRMNINENGEDTYIPLIYLKNNNNNIYVTLNRAMVEVQNVIKYQFSYEDCKINRNKKTVMYGNLPDMLFNSVMNIIPQVTTPE